MEACPKCYAEMNIQTMMLINVPSSMERQLTKHKLRSKDFKILGVLWGSKHSLYICPKCHHVEDREGNLKRHIGSFNEAILWKR